MIVDRLIIAIGVGITTFLAVTGAVSHLLEPTIGFSVLIGIPIGAMVGVITVAVVVGLLRRRPTRLLESGFLGIAGLGYSIVGLFAIRYGLTASRDFLELPVILAIGVLVAIGGFTYGWVRH